LGARINTMMQTVFFAISDILSKEQAIESLKRAIKKTYGRKGEKVVQMNFRAVDAALDALQEVAVPERPSGKQSMPPTVAAHAPDFVKKVTAQLMRQEGDLLPVSAMPDDGTWPLGTTKYEKRNVAVEIPEWNPGACLQCGMCSLVCPHAAIRVKVYDAAKLEGAPPEFKSVAAKEKQYAGMKYTVQVAPEDCTGCGVCVEMCPGKERDANKKPTGRKAINMAPQIPLRRQEAKNFDFFMDVPDMDPSLYNKATVKGSQFVRAMFEFSGACPGCGETAYVKLLTQLFGDRLYVGNATGCSSIYGGNLPTTPYTTREDGRGPTWSNSLFEDAAEFPFGMRLTVDKFNERALELIEEALSDEGCAFAKENRDLLTAIRDADQSTQADIEAQRARIAEMKEKLADSDAKVKKQLVSLADYLAKKSVWGLGGDGWAYDIGYGGLDHVLASGRNINLLVLDTEVYSNTGGQASKSTPMGAVARFAASGKPQMKKDLGLLSMTYGTIYVAKVAIGANPTQCVRAFVEAEAYDGPSIVIAYSHCIAHGIDMRTGLENQKRAVQSGHFPLYRYNPDLLKEGKNPLQLDSKPPKISYSDFASQENRFRVLQATNPERAKRLMDEADRLVAARYDLYTKLAAMEPYVGEGE